MTGFDDLTLRFPINLGYFDMYEQNKFHAQLSLARKKIVTSRPGVKKWLEINVCIDTNICRPVHLNGAPVSSYTLSSKSHE